MTKNVMSFNKTILVTTAAKLSPCLKWKLLSPLLKRKLFSASLTFSNCPVIINRPYNLNAALFWCRCTLTDVMTDGVLFLWETPLSPNIIWQVSRAHNTWNQLLQTNLWHQGTLSSGRLPTGLLASSEMVLTFGVQMARRELMTFGGENHEVQWIIFGTYKFAVWYWIYVRFHADF